MSCYDLGRKEVVIHEDAENTPAQIQVVNNDGVKYQVSELLVKPEPIVVLMTQKVPFEFQVWRNVTGKPDEQVYRDMEIDTVFYWCVGSSPTPKFILTAIRNNNQPAGSLVRFYIRDIINKYYSSTDFVPVLVSLNSSFRMSR